VSACTTCPRNERQADLIRRLWVGKERDRRQIERLRQRVETQQGMIDWLRAQKDAPTAEQVAEQIFKEAEHGQG
jgi:hypothetical protein